MLLHPTCATLLNLRPESQSANCLFCASCFFSELRCPCAANLSIKLRVRRRWWGNGAVALPPAVRAMGPWLCLRVSPKAMCPARSSCSRSPEGVALQWGRGDLRPPTVYKSAEPGSRPRRAARLAPGIHRSSCTCAVPICDRQGAYSKSWCARSGAKCTPR